MKAYAAPLGRPFCENRGNSPCDNYATHTVALEGVGDLGSRYCEDHATRIVESLNRQLAQDRASREGTDA